MKIFTKRLALVVGLLFTALICMGIVYIDDVRHYWQFSGGFIRLVVNTNAQAIITVDTNTMSVGINTNDSSRSFQAVGRKPADGTGANGTSAAVSGALQFQAGVGGDTTRPTTGTGGPGGDIIIRSGAGGVAPAAITNATGGAGGNLTLTGGAGGAGQTSGLATNTIAGGTGGTLSMAGGSGGTPTTAATNANGGAGGSFTLVGGNGATPTAGWSRRGGSGGGVVITAGTGGNSTRTNSGAGGNNTVAAGNSGNVLTTPGDAGVPGNLSLSGGNSGSAVAGGNPQPGGAVNLTAGSGSTGTTNSDGGHVFVVGGTPGSGAVPGNAVVGRDSAGTARGGLQVGPIVTGTTATLTNLLTITATLDFPSIAAGTIADLPVAFAGAADGDAVTLGVPLSSVTNCTWMGFASNSVVYIRAANGQLVTAQDPNSGSFRIVLQKYR